VAVDNSFVLPCAFDIIQVLHHEKMTTLDTFILFGYTTIYGMGVGIIYYFFTTFWKGNG